VRMANWRCHIGADFQIKGRRALEDPFAKPKLEVRAYLR
jgi:hypothetical protein